MLSDEQLNFAHVAIACVDIIKLPLIDILRSSVEPKDLCMAVQQCTSLMNSILNFEQKAKCGLSLHQTPDYSEFDVTLLSTLIQNLCADFKPQKHNKTNQQPKNKQLWENIMEIRRIKNNFLSHVSAAKLDKLTFDKIWNSIKTVLKNIQTFTKSMKYHNSDCLNQLDDLEEQIVEAKQYKSLIEKLKGKFALHTQMHFKSVN